MAFNPFHSFRKHQRKIFAALTILCMITFVMSSGVMGQGDFFGEIQRWFGGGSIPQAFRLAGKSYDLRDIQTIQRQRRKANEFMAYAVDFAFQKTAAELLGERSGLDLNMRQQLAGYLSQFQQAWYQAALFGNNSQAQQMVTIISAQLQFMEKSLETSKKLAEEERVRSLRLMLPRYLWLRRFPKDELFPESNLYFGGSLQPEGIVQFLVWLQEADRLGIRLKSEDVSTAMARETSSKLNDAEWDMLRKRVGVGTQGINLPEFEQAIVNEYRARIAQTTLLGYDPGGFPTVPTMITPDELFEYYRTQRTEYTVKMLPISVAKIQEAIKDKPAEAELQKLFDEYKSVEASPFKDTPGFKQPRRLKVEWIEANASAKAYRDRAQAQTIAQIAGLAALSNPLSACEFLAPYYSEYEISRSYHALPGFGEADARQAYQLFASLRKADAAVAMAGQFLGSAAMGDPLSAISATESIAYAREKAAVLPAMQAESPELAKLVASLFGSGVNDAAPLSFFGDWLALRQVRRYMPMEALLPDVTARLLARKSEDIMTASLASLTKDLKEKRAKPEEAAKVIDKYVKDYGWKHGQSEKLADQYQITEDPGLAPLKAAYVFSNSSDPKAKRMASQLFFGQGSEKEKTYEPKDRDVVFGENGRFTFWKTVDEPAKVLALDQARAAVEKAWMWQRAQEEAKKVADEIVAKSKTDALAALVAAAKARGVELIELSGVARLKNALSAREGFGGPTPYTVPEEKVEYPSRDFVEKILEMPDPGAVQLLTDAPKSTYYVAALVQKTVPTLVEFQRDTAGTMGRSAYLARFEDERRVAYRKALVKSLEERARFTILNEEEFKSIGERSMPTEE